METDLNEESLRPFLRGSWGAPARFYDTVGSTNSIALGWAEEGAPDGALVVADDQTAGRGRRGRSWSSRPGSSVLFSLVLRPGIPPGPLGLLALALGLGCARGIEEAAGIEAALRWPNDVTVQGRKIAGILTETRVEGGLLSLAVAGAGINHGWPRAEMPEDIRPSATSISDEISPDRDAPERALVLGAVVSCMEEECSTISDDVEGLLERASDRSEILGGPVQVTLGDGRILRGTAAALAEDGALSLDVDGSFVTVHTGDLERLRPG